MPRQPSIANRRSTDQYFLDERLAGDFDFRLCASFADRKTRMRLAPVYALLFEWRELLVYQTEAEVAQRRLIWWLEEWQRSANGQPRHPITRSLTGSLGAGTKAWRNLLALASDETADSTQAVISTLEPGARLLANCAQEPVACWRRSVLGTLVAADREFVQSETVLMPADIRAATGIRRKQLRTEGEQAWHQWGKSLYSELVQQKCGATGLTGAFAALQMRRLRSLKARRLSPFSKLHAAWRGARGRQG